MTSRVIAVVFFFVISAAATGNEQPLEIRNYSEKLTKYRENHQKSFLASFIKICSQSDPKLGACIRKSILGMKTHLRNGIPELDVPSLDPLFVHDIVIPQAGGIQVTARFKNITISGPTKFRLRSVRADVESDKFRIKLWFPELVMKAVYEIKGQLLMMPINGRGACFGNFSDIDGVLSTKFNRVKKDSKDHFKVDLMQIEFNIGNAKVHLDNLFNGDEELTKSMNFFINENWRLVTAELRPTLEKVIAEILTETADKLFERYPIEKLLIP